MAQKRMFNREIMFCDTMMKLTPAQFKLYVLLNMDADDKGMVGNAGQLVSYSNARKADLQKLIDAGFIIDFGTGIYCVAHWKKHNTIRKDSDHGTLHTREYSLLNLTEEGVYYKALEGISVTDDNSRVEESSIEEKQVSSSTVDTGCVTAATLPGATTTDQRILDLVNLWNENPSTITLTNDDLNNNLEQLQRLIDSEGYATVASVIYSLHSKQFFLAKRKVEFSWFLIPDHYNKIKSTNFYDDTSISDRVSLDRDYIDRYSGWIDNHCADFFEVYQREQEEKKRQAEESRKAEADAKEQERIEQEELDRINREKQEEQDRARRESDPEFQQWLLKNPGGVYATFAREQVEKRLKNKVSG